MRAVRTIPVVALGGAAVVLLLLWPKIPERWVTHWGADGQPNGWAVRSPFGVFFPIALGVAVCLLMEAIAWGMRQWASRADARRAPREVIDATNDFLRLIAAALAVLFAMIAVVLPLASPARPASVVVAALALITAAVAIGLVRFRRAVRVAHARDPKGLAGWNGLTYRNPQDPRIWVPKLAGPGYTLNFAHRRAWVYFALLLALPAAAIAAVLASLR